MTVKNIEQLLELQAIDKLLFDLQRDTQQPTPHDDSAPLLCSNLVVAEAQRCDLYHKRDIVTHSIDPRMLALYYHTRGRGGIRIAASRRGACGCCFHQLPPQNLNEARHATRPITCDHCSCLVVWDEQSEST